MVSAATEAVLATELEQPSFVIPKLCRAGVVVDEGPNFYVVGYTLNPIQADEAGGPLGNECIGEMASRQLSPFLKIL
jgi:hypothetical protein